MQLIPVLELLLYMPGQLLSSRCMTLEATCLTSAKCPFLKALRAPMQAECKAVTEFLDLVVAVLQVVSCGHTL